MTAPYRADHVGSLLRPDSVHDARAQFNAEELGPDGFSSCDELKSIEDEAIRDMVALQEAAGRRRLPTWSARYGAVMKVSLLLL